MMYFETKFNDHAAEGQDQEEGETREERQDREDEQLMEQFFQDDEEGGSN